MDKLIEGLKRFKRETYPRLKPLYDNLIKTGQKPRALIIGCADSRVAFETLTGCGPGELFIVRNAGNIVPRYGTYVGGVTASIEFAVTQLPIEDVIICGHTHCGAIAGLLDPDSLRDMPAVRDWLNFSKQASERVRKADTRTISRHKRAATSENVKLQLENLHSFPCIAERLGAGSIKLHGWVYELETGDVLEYDEKTRTWNSLTGDEPVKPPPPLPQ
ncbi:MAG: carbonic anhydrase [Planctomycetes bacterium]|nr:carbonic anhydrase [Planctomycetota bacterium]